MNLKFIFALIELTNFYGYLNAAATLYLYTNPINSSYYDITNNASSHMK